MTPKRLWIFVLCLLVIPILLAQQPGEISYKDVSVLPEGIKGQRIQSLIKAVNSRDPEFISCFVKENFSEKFLKLAPMEEHVDIVLGIYDQSGGLDFHSIRHYTPERKDETVVIVKDRLFQSWRAFVFHFEESPDSLITGLQFTDARVPSNVTEKPLAENDLVLAVQKIMQRIKEKEAFSGAVLLAKGKEILFKDAGGEASKRFHVSNNINTKFNLGSMNKMFTSLCIMKLVEEGKLSLNDTLDKFLDETWFPDEVSSKIAILHLLTHTSGLGSYFNQEYDRGSRTLWRELDDYKPLIKDDRPAFKPGERFQYSNTGMFLLGVVIEKVTGQDYFSYVREQIYEPAGMENTGCYEMDYPVENLAIGYSPARESPYGWQNNLYKHVIKGGPAGGGFSTVVDLHRFGLALLEGKLVSRESLDQMGADHAGVGYGYGFTVRETAKGKVIGHGGGFSGINSNLDVFVESGYIVAVMSNIDMGASPLARKIRELILEIK
ncbi:MAG: serine hydrolase domain-containing protein [Candidatus Aminicenantes bacterium]